MPDTRPNLYVCPECDNTLDADSIDERAKALGAPEQHPKCAVGHDAVTMDYVRGTPSRLPA